MKVQSRGGVGRTRNGSGTFVHLLREGFWGEVLEPEPFES